MKEHRDFCDLSSNRINIIAKHTPLKRAECVFFIFKRYQRTDFPSTNPQQNCHARTQSKGAVAQVSAEAENITRQS